MEAYRICERKGDNLLTLFHAVRGSRVLPLDKWITADVKEVQDGSRKTSKTYLSGFHSLPTLNDCRKFSTKFRAKRDLVIVKCEVKGETWEKKHSPAPIILSRKIKLVEIVEEIKL